MTVQRIKLGRKGEESAVAFLKRQGYKILSRNFSNVLGEIDIIAQEEDTICFIEVRTRTSDEQGHPFESITKNKRRKLTQTASSYLKYKNLHDWKARFDVVAVIPHEDGSYDIDIIKNAFDAEF